MREERSALFFLFRSSSKEGGNRLWTAPSAHCLCFLNRRRLRSKSFPENSIGIFFNKHELFYQNNSSRPILKSKKKEKSTVIGMAWNAKCPRGPRGSLRLQARRSIPRGHRPAGHRHIGGSIAIVDHSGFMFSPKCNDFFHRCHRLVPCFPVDLPSEKVSANLYH